jgi:hypothetical protein
MEAAHGTKCGGFSGNYSRSPKQMPSSYFCPSGAFARDGGKPVKAGTVSSTSRQDDNCIWAALA